MMVSIILLRSFNVLNKTPIQKNRDIFTVIAYYQDNTHKSEAWATNLK